MATINEIKKTRIKKLNAIRSAGFLVYPRETKRTHNCGEALKNFSNFSHLKKEIILAGRIMSLRQHGGLVFSHIEDGFGRIQILFKKDILGEKNYQFFLDNFDIGDFIEAKGVLFKTKKGEQTLEVQNYKILAKSLLPLPEKWHGLSDIEERYRKRYLDLIFNKEVKEKFEIRGKIIDEMRKIFDKEGFLEVETPMFHPIYGGANARPFKTHLNALDIDLYLRISPELYLKRLLVGGLEKFYEIGKCFRNEGVDKSHNPDFTMLELYWAYTDYKNLMKFIEKMITTLVKNIFGGLEVEYEGKKINFKTPWQRIEFSQLLKKYAKIDLDGINARVLKIKAQKLGIEVGKGEGKAEIADKIYKKYCLPEIFQPTFVIHHPLGLAPLAKSLEENPSKLARFQVLTGGLEIINAFSELNDPIEQKKRFQEQEKIFKEGFDEAQRMDEDFIEALEYGMPPAAGFGLGIDRLVALLTNSHNVREVILFPTMRPK